MPGKGRGERESVWHVIRRCQAILHRVQQGPAKKAGLLEAVYAAVGDDAYGGSEGENLAKKFEADKRRLRERLGIDVRYDAEAGGYVIAGHETPFFNLPDAHLETLAFLADTFEPDSPHGRQVQELVDMLTGWLPAGRRRAYQKMRGLLPEVDLRLRDSEPIAPDVWEKVLAAHNERRQLQFDYLSTSHADDVPRQHIVEPWHLYFSERGHYRLDAYCIFNDGPHGPWEPKRFFNYRLSRIVPGSVEVLPRKLPVLATLLIRIASRLVPSGDGFPLSALTTISMAPRSQDLDK